MKPTTTGRSGGGLSGLGYYNINKNCIRPRNNEPLNILLTSLSKLIRSGLIFLSKHSSFRSLQEYIFRISFEHILSSV